MARAIVLGILGGLIGLLAAFTVFDEADRYEATARLLVGPLSAERSSLDAAGLLTRTYAEILEGRDLLETVAAELDADADEYEVTAIGDQRSRIIILSVVGPEPELPGRVANTLTARLDELIRSTTDETAPDSGLGEIRVLEQPLDEAEPVTGYRSAVSLLAMLFGVAAGVAVAQLWTAIRAPEPADGSVLPAGSTRS